MQADRIGPLDSKRPRGSPGQTNKLPFCLEKWHSFWGTRQPATGAHELAEESLTVFRSARWHVQGRPGLAPDVIDVDMSGGPIPEVMVGISDSQHPSAAAAAVFKAFHDMGCATQYQPVGIDAHTIQITVGPKPVVSASPLRT